MKRPLLACAIALTCSGVALGQALTRPPIIDMHLHAQRANSQGPPPIPMCFRTTEWTPVDPKVGLQGIPFSCARPVQSPPTDDSLMRWSLRELERYNIVGVTSGALTLRWKAESPRRIIAAYGLASPSDISVDSLRKLFERGVYRAFSEIGTQYQGIAPNDSVMEPYWAMAEALDIPVGIHMGMGPPGTPYIPGLEKYRGRLSNPLLLEDVLVRHPKMRVWVMHAGWPMLDQMLQLMITHPQVYVDVGVIDFVLPRPEFYRYLRTLVEAGFGQRIMFGSDQMVWPQAIGEAVAAIEEAPFLSAKQKRDILYNNAARFLRLENIPVP